MTLFSFRSVTLQLIILFVASLAFMTFSIVNQRALLRTDALVALETIRIADRVAVIAALLDEVGAEERTDVVSITRDSSVVAALDSRSWIENDAAKDSRTEGLVALLSAIITRADKRDIRVSYLSTAIDPERFAGLQMSYNWPRLDVAEPLETMIHELLSGPAFLISLRLTDGTWANFIASYAVTLDLWQGKEISILATMAVAIAGLSIWGIRLLTKPFRLFAHAAARLGSDVRAPPIKQQGPLEVRMAIDAFNTMQLNLQRLIADRTLMLASISHDLRTPLTRMRLRTEFIKNRAQRQKQLADLTHMELMISEILDFAKQDASNERAVKVELTALLRRLSEDFSDQAHPVTFKGGPPTHIESRPLALERCLTNLINNAVWYGGRADMSIERTQSNVLVHIDDCGPGIPEEQHEAVFRPFYRLDESRNSELGGTGLGLAVARSIARANGGDIVLGNRPSGGLRATLVLPVRHAAMGDAMETTGASDGARTHDLRRDRPAL